MENSPPIGRALFRKLSPKKNAVILSKVADSRSERAEPPKTSPLCPCPPRSRYNGPVPFAIEAAPSAAAAPDSGKGKKNLPPIPPANVAIAGFIVAEAARASGHIITIDVIADARRSGVGSLLLRAAEDRLRATPCRSVELETAVDNISALSFYKHHGYSVIKTFPRYYANGVDALVLQKEII